MPHSKKLYWEHREKGLCVECSENAIPGRAKCSWHTISHSIYDKIAKEKYKINKRCISCGLPLHDEMDEGHVKCLQCRDGIVRRSL